MNCWAWTSPACCTASRASSSTAFAHAGEQLSFRQRIADIYDKKGGALEFIVRHTAVSNQRGEPVADLRCVTVYRNPAP